MSSWKLKLTSGSYIAIQTQMDTNDDPNYKWWSVDWTKWIDFVEMKFHLNEKIEWHCMQLELNFNSINIEFRLNWIELKFLIVQSWHTIIVDKDKNGILKWCFIVFF